jgi:hypothetical protein
MSEFPSTHAKIKAALRQEIDSLRASNAALIAENETAVKNMAALQSELAAFKNWQPSDPGTKEAMECDGIVDEEVQANGQNGLAFDSWDKIAVRYTALKFYGRWEKLCRLYRAAMVRLEEAENNPRDGRLKLKEERDTLNRRLSALTASLATRTEERDSYLDAVTLAESELDELRKRMGEAETLLRGEQEGWDCGPGECDDNQCHFHIIQRFLASPPRAAGERNK